MTSSGRRRTGRRRLGIAAVVVVSLLVVAVAGGLVYARPLLKTGTGYAAHNACAVRLVAGRGADQPDRDLPPNPLVPYLRTSVSRDSARSSVLGVLYPQTAYFVRGRGCVVAGERPTTAAPPTVTPFTLPVETSTRPDEVRRGVDAALDRAFGADEQARRALGTRAVVVVQHGRIVAERYADGFTPDTRQLGWSMGKSVTNLMAGRLVQQNKLNVLERHLRPEWTDPQRDAITVENLLRMTSGLEWDETYALGTPITRMLYLEPDMGGYAASLPSVHAPGSYQQYSSGTTNILCQVLEQRSGLDPDLPGLVVEPLGLASAVWEPDAAGHPVCSSYLWATPRDWATIGQFALQKGVWKGQRLLPADWMDRSTSMVGDVAGEEDGFAASWWVNRRADGSLVAPGVPADAYWASGHDGQQLTVVPSEDLVVLRMGFTPEGDDGIDQLVADVARAVTSTA